MIRFGRKRQSDRCKRRVHALAALGDRLVRQADDRESRQTGGKLDLDFDGPGFEPEVRNSCDGGRHAAPPRFDNGLRRHPPNSARRLLARASGRPQVLAVTAASPHIFPMITREQWRTFIDHPVVEWTIFVVGMLLLFVVAPLVGAFPGPGGVFVAGDRPCDGAEDQRVGQAALRPLQALAAKGGRLGRLGTSPPERAAPAEAAEGARGTGTGRCRRKARVVEALAPDPPLTPPETWADREGRAHRDRSAN